MFRRRARELAEKEAKVTMFYHSVVDMKKETLLAARFIFGCCSVFLFFVRRLETHQALYAAVDRVFAAKGHPLAEMKEHCVDIELRLRHYLSTENPWQ